MNWLPQDLTSFVWGFVVAVVVMLAAGFRRRSEKDLAPPAPPPRMPLSTVTQQVPEPARPPEAVQVDLQFKPTLYKPDDCVWVRIESLARFEADGYSYYPHPSNGAKCVRGYDNDATFLMVNPYAEKPAT